MQIGPVALKIRLAETRFGNNVFGAAELAMALEYTLKQDCAFVVQVSETATNNNLDGGISQVISEKFAVMVALNNGESEKGKTGVIAFDKLAEARAQIFKAILGWQITGAESLVEYAGGKVAGINRAYLWYQFEFTVDTRIDDDDGVGIGVDTEDLGYFDTLYAQWVLTPSLNATAVEGASALPVTTIDPDMTSIIDFTKNKDVDGPFGAGFGIRFDTFKP